MNPYELSLSLSQIVDVKLVGANTNRYRTVQEFMPALAVLKKSWMTLVPIGKHSAVHSITISLYIFDFMHTYRYYAFKTARASLRREIRLHTTTKLLKRS